MLYRVLASSGLLLGLMCCGIAVPGDRLPREAVCGIISNVENASLVMRSNGRAIAFLGVGNEQHGVVVFHLDNTTTKVYPVTDPLIPHSLMISDSHLDSNVSIISATNGKQQLILNGQPQHPYDEIPLSSVVWQVPYGVIYFAREGKKWRYVADTVIDEARYASDWYDNIMTNSYALSAGEGKSRAYVIQEGTRFRVVSDQHMEGFQLDPPCDDIKYLQFLPAKDFRIMYAYYIQWNKRWCLLVDKMPAATTGYHWEDIGQPAVHPNSTVYFPIQYKGKWCLMRYGKLVFSPGTAQAMYYNPDGTIFRTIANDGTPRNYSLTSTISALYAQLRSPVLAVKGTRVVYAASDGVQWRIIDNPHGSYGDEIPGPGCEAVSDPVVTPDGTHLAYAACQQQQWRLVLDGTAGTETYDELTDLQWSRNGQRCYARARRGTQWTVLVDGKPSPWYDAVGALTLGAEAHVAYPAKTAAGWQMVVDGTAQAAYAAVGAPVFSASGEAIAYAAQRDNRWCAVIQGHEGPWYTQIMQQRIFSIDVKYYGNDAWHYYALKPADPVAGEQRYTVVAVTHEGRKR